MPETQSTPISTPLPTDENLQVYSATIQANLFDLFNYAHQHALLTAAPTSTQGTVGDIALVQLGTAYYIYAKVGKTLWKRVLLS